MNLFRFEYSLDHWVNEWEDGLLIALILGRFIFNNGGAVSFQTKICLTFLATEYKNNTFVNCNRTLTKYFSHHFVKQFRIMFCVK